MNNIAYSNYIEGKHRTFYESMIGGYDSKQSEAYKYVAKTLNTHALERITNPTRNSVPLGFVFMNYAIAPKKAGSTTEEEDGYNSAALIRAIINNNKAFLLNRASGTPAPNVEESTNSHFNNNSQNPLKQ